jgi:tetratricopeptide (TPR) repeat protein
MLLEEIINNMKDGNIDLLEDALLLVSKVREKKLEEYKGKIGAITNDFDNWAKKNNRKYDVADKEDEKKVIKSLFDYFWQSKPNRYNDEFLLNKVIDNQLSKDNNGVGDCLGLTSLYSVVCIRKGIRDLKILESSNHILNCHGSILIENTDNHGFNMNKDDEEFIDFSNGELIQLIVSNYCSLGIAEAEDGKIEEAMKYYSNAMRINPDYSDIYCHLGVAEAKAGNIENAMEYYDTAIKKNPNNSNAYTNRGVAKFKSGDIANAIKDYDKALKINMNNSDAYYNMGIAEAELGNFTGAIKYFSNAIRLDPNNSEAYTNRGTAKAKKGNFIGAAEDFNIALKINPNDSNAHYNREMAKSEYAKQLQK